MGIAGDMTIGALLDAGMPFSILKQELKKLRLGGCDVSVKKVKSGAFRASKFCVHLKPEAKHEHTSLKEIEQRIKKSRLDSKVKKLATSMFQNLGKAEARVHGVPIGQIHFHEAGAIDSFVDVVGTAICFHHLSINKAYVRHLRVGRGVQQGDHGEMPIPVPGAYELLKGFQLEQADYEQEMVTPTGAVILATLCEKNSKIPRARIQSVGYGAGDREMDGHRGLLRVSIGRTA